MNGYKVEFESSEGTQRIGTYSTPEEAIKIAKLLTYGGWRADPDGKRGVEHDPIDPESETVEVWGADGCIWHSDEELVVASVGYCAVYIGRKIASDSISDAQANRVAQAFNRLRNGDESERKFVEAWIRPEFVPAAPKTTVIAAPKTTVIYVQNPEMCDTQGYWEREEGDPVPEQGDGADGWIGGNGWPSEFMVGGGDDKQRADRFIRQCLGLTGPYRWEYVNIRE